MKLSLYRFIINEWYLKKETDVRGQYPQAVALVFQNTFSIWLQYPQAVAPRLSEHLLPSPILAFALSVIINTNRSSRGFVGFTDSPLKL
jgi:hypothetical protein